MSWITQIFETKKITKVSFAEAIATKNIKLLKETAIKKDKKLLNALELSFNNNRVGNDIIIQSFRVLFETKKKHSSVLGAEIKKLLSTHNNVEKNESVVKLIDSKGLQRRQKSYMIKTI